MITINSQQIQDIVERLKIEHHDCAIATDEEITNAVIKWLNSHIESLVEEPEWWIQFHSKGLNHYGLPTIWERKGELTPYEI